MTISLFFFLLVFVTLSCVVWFIERDRRRGKITIPRKVIYGSPLPYKILLSFYNALVSATCGKDLAFESLETWPELQRFSDNWETIRDEALAIYSKGEALPIKGDLFFRNIIKDERWRRFYIKWYSEPLPEAWRVCPKTTELVQAAPSVHLAMFSILEPGAVITPHIGLFRGSFRYHLGLDCPSKDCQIWVDGMPYQWKNGEGVLFDDTYYHEVKNESDQLRLILFLDVERKFPSPVMKAINRWMCKHIISLTTRANDKQEKALTIIEK